MRWRCIHTPLREGARAHSCQRPAPIPRCPAPPRPALLSRSGILDARLFAALPRGALLVNVSRGQHLVEADLLAALDAGQLSGAVLDGKRSGLGRAAG